MGSPSEARPPSRGWGGGGSRSLGRALARSGVMAKLALAVAALTVLGVTALAFRLARSHGDALEEVPKLASTWLAWGAGTLLLLGASMRAFPLDREHGIRALVRARGCEDARYLWTRVGGLATTLAVVVAGGTAFTGLVAMLLGHGAQSAARTLQASGAALVYGLAFAHVLAPVGMATLAARSRAGGYALLALVLIAPELLRGWLTTILPEGWGALASIPGALLGLRTSLSPGQLDGWLFARSFAILALVAALALLALRVELTALDRSARGGAR